MSEWLAAKNILALRMDNLGDVVMLGPALRAIKESAPEARLTLLASPGGAAAAALLPWVDDTIIWRSLWQDLGDLPFDPARERELVEMLAVRRFDAAIIFTSFNQSPHPSGYVCYLAGIPLRAGESKEFGGAVLSHELRGAPDELHQVERNLRLVEMLGFRARHRHLMVAFPTEARTAAVRLVAGVGFDPDAPFVLLHPGASASARRYPAERFGMAARLLGEHGLPVLVTGVEREAALVQAVLAEAPQARALLAPTALAEYAALLERAALVLCNNTLPMHLGEAVGTPMVVLFAGTELEEQWRPRAAPARLLRRPTPCQPCYLFRCPIGHPCLDIPPEEVAEAALLLIEHAEERSTAY
jgi:ADP-heptose:LPS heptosyltransferase